MAINSRENLAVPNIEKYTTQYFEFKKDIFSSFNYQHSKQASQHLISDKKISQSSLVDNNFLPHLLINNQGFVALNKSSFFKEPTPVNSDLELSIVDEKFSLPRVCAHYNIKTQEELRQIDEANRKLLAISEDENFQAKMQSLDQQNQLTIPQSKVSKTNYHSLKRNNTISTNK